MKRGLLLAGAADYSETENTEKEGGDHMVLKVGDTTLTTTLSIVV